MRVLLEIKDDKALHLIEVLKSIPYVKTISVSNEKASLIEEIKEAVENINLVKEGKIKAKSARELLNEI